MSFSVVGGSEGEIRSSECARADDFGSMLAGELNTREPVKRWVWRSGKLVAVKAHRWRVLSAGARARSVALVVAAAGVISGRAQAADLMRDDFNGSTLNTSIWGIGTWSLGRTQLGFTPQVTGGIARLRLDTYNPANPGGSFKGSELWTNAQYARGVNGLELEARVKVNPLPDGLVTSFFTYAARTNFNPPLADEIDFEHVSKQDNAAGAGVKPILLTTWNDYRTDGSNFGDPNVHSSVSVVAGGVDLATYNTYRIRWLGNRVEWYVNGLLMRTATQAVSTDPMNIRLNVWAPANDWGDAYASSLTPAATAAANHTYLYDLDWVAVRNAYNPVSATGVNRVFTDRFKNGSVANSDSVTGFWSQRNQGGGAVTETTADPLKLSVSGAGYPHAQVASAVRSEFNFFNAPIRLTADGIDFSSTSATSAGTGTFAKSILRFVFSPQTLATGTESEYTSEDALSLRIEGDNSVALGYKVNAANQNSEFTNVLMNATVSGPVRRFTLTLSPLSYTLVVEHELSATDGTRVSDTFTGALSLNLSDWRVGTTSAATGSSAMYIQGQLNNAVAGEQMTAMVDSMSVDTVKSSWAVNAAGSWNAVGSWSSDGVPSFSGANAVFGNVITAPRTVTVSSPVTVGVLQFDSAQRYTVSGESVTMSSPGTSAEIDVISGSHTVGSAMVLASNTLVSIPTSTSVLTLGTVTGTGSLTKSGAGRLEVGSIAVPSVAVTGGSVRVLANGTAGAVSVVNSISVTSGLFDVVDNDVVVRSGDLAGLRLAVKNWWNGGARNGSGIGSSVASAGGFTTVAVFGNAEFYSSYDGVTLGANDVIVRYAYLGDTDINGVVDGKDLANVIEGLSLGLTGWGNGDVNYDGVVNSADVGLVVGALNAGLPSLGDGQGVEGGEGAIPEPGGCAVVVGALLGGAGMRRRRA